MSNQYDEIKDLLRKTRMILEQSGPNNMALSIEDEIESDTEEKDDVKKDKSKSYRISGGIITLHGKDKSDLELTTIEKQAFQEIMDEYVEEVSDLTEFSALNVYDTTVQWGGKILDTDIEFFFSVGEDNGVYINGNMIKLDDQLTELVNKLTTFYDKFKVKWTKVLSLRKKTQIKK
jgi:hypothetical protein